MKRSVNRLVRSILVSLVACVAHPMPCAADGVNGDDRIQAATALGAVAAELDSVKASMDAILRRRVFTVRLLPSDLAFSGQRGSKLIRPSDAYVDLSHSPRLPHARAIQRLLDAAVQRRPIGQEDATACFEDAWELVPSKPVPFAPSEAIARAAKRLDAVLVVALERCPANHVRLLNHPDASKPTDVNSVAVKSEADREQLAEMNMPYEVARSDWRAVMLAQAYFFDQAEDPAIPISSFLIRAAERSFNAAQMAVAPYARLDGNLSMVFNRTSTSIGDQLKALPHGYFGAVGSGQKIYLSPTIVRATLVACVGKVSFAPGLSYRIREEFLPSVKSGGTSATVGLDMARAAQATVSGVENCVSDQLTFLIGHELAHKALKISSEEGADCVGAVISKRLRNAGQGIFGELVFNLAGTPEEELTGSSANAVRQLICRRQAPYLVEAPFEGDMGSAIEACRAYVDRCK